jgi:hypothetical protein
MDEGGKMKDIIALFSVAFLIFIVAKIIVDMLIIEMEVRNEKNK